MRPLKYLALATLKSCVHGAGSCHAGFMVEPGDRDIGVRPKQASQRAAPVFASAKQLDQAFSLIGVVAAARRLDANLAG